MTSKTGFGQVKIMKEFAWIENFLNLALGKVGEKNENVHIFITPLTIYTCNTCTGHCIVIYWGWLTFWKESLYFYYKLESSVTYVKVFHLIFIEEIISVW